MEIAGLLGLDLQSRNQDSNQQPTALDLGSDSSHACLSSNQEDVKQLVKRHLEAQNRSRWLLIVDNVDDERLIDMLLTWVPHSPTGRTLYTSRSTRVVQDLVGSDAIEIAKLEELDAMDLVKRSLLNSCSTDQDDLRSLLQDLDYLPLALTQAAAYMNRNSVSPAKYCQLLGGTDQGFIRLMSSESRDRTRYQEVGNAVATTWVVSFDQIRAQDPIAADLLQFISCIEWRDIPLSILPGRRSAHEMMETIGTLCSYSFLSLSGRPDFYTMHRLVHLATQMWVGRYSNANAVLSNALAHLDSVFPFDFVVTREQWRAYLPHAIRVLDNGVDANDDIEAGLCFRIGVALRTDRRSQESLQWLNRCTRKLRTFPEDNPESLLRAEQELARVYQLTRQLDEGIRLMEHVVSTRRRCGRTNISIQLQSEAFLGWLYIKGDQTALGLTELETVVHRMIKFAAEKVSVRPHKKMPFRNGPRRYRRPFRALNSRQETRFRSKFEFVEEQKSLSPAQSSTAHTREDKDKMFLDSVSDAECFPGFSAQFQNTGRSKQRQAATFEEWIIRALMDLTFDREALDEIGEHVWISTIECLANSYLASGGPGRFETAITVLELVHKVWASPLADINARRIGVEYSLVKAYLEEGYASNVKKAIDLMEHVAEVESRRFHANEYEYLHAQHLLARAYLKSKEPYGMARGIEILEDAVPRMMKVLKDDDLRGLSAQHCLVKAYLETDQPENIQKAIRLWERVDTILARTDQKNSWPHLRVAHGLAKAYKDSHQSQAIFKAVKLLQHAVTVPRHTLRDDEPSQLELQRSLASAYLKTNQHENLSKAVELLENIVNAPGKTFDEDDSDRTRSQELPTKARKAKDGLMPDGRGEYAEAKPSKRSRAWTVVEFFRGSFTIGGHKKQKI